MINTNPRAGLVSWSSVQLDNTFMYPAVQKGIKWTLFQQLFVLKAILPCTSHHPVKIYGGFEVKVNAFSASPHIGCEIGFTFRSLCYQRFPNRSARSQGSVLLRCPSWNYNEVVIKLSYFCVIPVVVTLFTILLILSGVFIIYRFFDHS
jgi:hypothetical protein